MCSFPIPHASVDFWFFLLDRRDATPPPPHPPAAASLNTNCRLTDPAQLTPTLPAQVKSHQLNSHHLNSLKFSPTQLTPTQLTQLNVHQVNCSELLMCNLWDCGCRKLMYISQIQYKSILGYPIFNHTRVPLCFCRDEKCFGSLRKSKSGELAHPLLITFDDLSLLEATGWQFKRCTTRKALTRTPQSHCFSAQPKSIGNVVCIKSRDLEVSRDTE